MPPTSACGTKAPISIERRVRERQSQIDLLAADAAAAGKAAGTDHRIEIGEGDAAAIPAQGRGPVQFRLQGAETALETIHPKPLLGLVERKVAGAVDRNRPPPFAGRLQLQLQVPGHAIGDERCICKHKVARPGAVDAEFDMAARHAERVLETGIQRQPRRRGRSCACRRERQVLRLENGVDRLRLVHRRQGDVDRRHSCDGLPDERLQCGEIADVAADAALQESRRQYSHVARHRCLRRREPQVGQRDGAIFSQPILGRD